MLFLLLLLLLLGFKSIRDFSDSAVDKLVAL